MSAINPYSTASVPNIISQFVPEQLPTELILNKLNQEQQLQDAYYNKALSIGDYDQRAIYETDKAYVKETKKNIKTFVDEAMNMDFNNPENRHKVINFVRDLRQDEKLKTIASNVASYDEMMKERQKIISEGKSGEYFDLQLANINKKISDYEKTGKVDKVLFNTLQGDLDRREEMAKYMKELGNTEIAGYGNIIDNYGNLDIDVIKKVSRATNEPQVQAALNSLLNSYGETPAGKQSKELYNANFKGFKIKEKDAKGNIVERDFTFNDYLINEVGAGKYVKTKYDEDVKVLRSASDNINRRKEQAAIDAKNKLVYGSTESGQDKFSIIESDLESTDKNTVNNAIEEYKDLARQGYASLDKLSKEKADRALNDYNSFFNKLSNEKITNDIKNVINNSSNDLIEISNNIFNYIKKSGLSTKLADIYRNSILSPNGGAKNKTEVLNNVEKIKNNSKYIVEKSKEMNLPYLGDMEIINNLYSYNKESIDNQAIKELTDYSSVKNFFGGIADNYKISKDIINKSIKGMGAVQIPSYSLVDTKAINDMNAFIGSHSSELNTIGSWASDEEKALFESAISKGDKKLQAVKLVYSGNNKITPKLMFEVPGKFTDANNKVIQNKQLTFTLKSADEISQLPNNDRITNMYEEIFNWYGDTGKTLKENYLNRATKVNTKPEMSKANDINRVVANRLNNNYSGMALGYKYDGLNTDKNIAKVDLNPTSADDWKMIEKVKKLSGTYNNDLPLDKTIKIGDGLLLMGNRSNLQKYFVDNQNEFNEIMNNVINSDNSLSSLTDTQKNSIKQDARKVLVDGQLTNDLNYSAPDYLKNLSKAIELFSNKPFPATQEFLEQINSVNYLNTLKSNL